MKNLSLEKKSIFENLKNVSFVSTNVNYLIINILIIVFYIEILLFIFNL